MRLLSADAWLPTVLAGESVDLRRRARLILYALGIAVSVDVITAFAMPYVGWVSSRPLWAAAHLSMHLPTLLVLFATRSVAMAGNYFIAIVFLQSTFQLESSNGFSAFGLVALPVAAAHLIGLRSAMFWTIAAVAAAFLAPLAIGANAQVAGLGVGVGTITLAIGAASVIVESSRARSAIEQNAAEASMQLHRDRLRAVVEQTFPCIAEVREGRLVFVSDSVVGLLGHTPAEILALNVELLRPEDVARLAARVSSRAIARTREEIRVRHSDGRWRWLEVFAIPFGASSAEAHWLFAARGIDEEVQHRERIEQAQRLDGISKLAAGIAHDFNNLLTVISGFGEQLPLSEAREHVLSAAAAAGELTNQLLAFGRSGPRADELIDPERELAALAPVIRSLLGEEVGFALRGSARGATSRISRGRFKQVLLNLVTNAKEAMPRGGALEIEIRRVSLAPERAQELRLSAGAHVEVAVRDTGIGMSEEVRARAFDPFFSTKGAEGGSGLGLASAYGIARRCQGTIALESAENAGTTARFYLPDAEEPLGPPEAQAALPSPLGPARVWVVEDDARIRKLVCGTLDNAGYQARPVADAAAALALLASEPAPQVLVTDIVMPGMRGTELAARMRTQSPRLRVLYVSGYSEIEVGDSRSGVQGVRFLAKPFRPAELLGAVAKLLTD